MRKQSAFWIHSIRREKNEREAQQAGIPPVECSVKEDNLNEAAFLLSCFIEDKKKRSVVQNLVRWI